MKIQELIQFFEMIFPPCLSESFDNTGFLIGDRNKDVHSVMTCLTITPDCIDEAKKYKIDLIVSHHPFPFLQAKRWTADTPDGRTLLSLVENNIAVYSPHTAHDSALYGINEQLARRLELEEIEPICPAPLGEVIAKEEMLLGLDSVDDSLHQKIGKALGTGRIGLLKKEITLNEFTNKVHKILNCPVIQVVGDDLSIIRKVAIGCGAAESFLDHAVKKGADVLLVGEAKFHTWLKADACSISLVMPGHYYSERFAMEVLAERLTRQFPQLDIHVSKEEHDPVHYSFK